MAKINFTEVVEQICEKDLRFSSDAYHFVFNLVSASVLGKNDTDSPGDFKNVFTFDDAFVKPFVPRNVAPLVRKTSSTKTKKRSSTGAKKKKAGSL